MKNLFFTALLSCMFVVHTFAQNEVEHPNYWRVSFGLMTTTVFYDLMDDNVDYETISGYSLSEIQDFLRYSYGAGTLCENLQLEPLHGTTVAQIEQLMQRYQDITYFN